MTTSSSTTPQVLVVGAGAVGQVFALLLRRAGAEVTFFVRRPVDVDLRLFEQGGSTETLRAAQASNLDAVRGRAWQQVWLTVPAPALAGPWLPELLQATGDAAVVVLAPEGCNVVPLARLAVGGIPFMAWQHPLPNQLGSPGIAWWWPPLAAVPLSGARAGDVEQLLNRGGVRTQRVADVVAFGAPVTALLNASVAALETVGWKVALLRGEALALAASAAQEMMQADGVSSVWVRLARPWLLRAVWWLALKVAPFDLEAYVQYHFTKLGGQTREGLLRWTVAAKVRGTPTSALDTLARTLPPLVRSSTTAEPG